MGTTPTPLDRFGRKRADFAKVSLGAEDMMEWEHSEDIKKIVEELKSQGFKIISLEQHSKAKKLEARGHKLEAFVLVVGNEVDGVSEAVLDMSDEVVEIEMKGKKESLNVSVATGIALFALLS